MGHWLEDAEKRQSKTRKRTSAFIEKIERKKALIRNNYEQNAEQYDGFIRTMQQLIKRVNDLPESLRQPFQKLNWIEKKSKLNNRLYVFSSSRRYKKRSSSFFNWFKLLHTKHIRVLYVFISKDMNFVDFEIKENYLIRERLKDKHKSNSGTNGKKPHGKDRLHAIYKIPFSELTYETGMQIIDWLAFKKDLNECPFWANYSDESKLFF